VVIIKRAFWILSFTFVSLSANAAGTSRFTFETLEFLNEPAAPVSRNEVLLGVDYEKRFRLWRSLGFQFHPVARASSLKESRSEQIFFDPREAYLEWRRKQTFLRSGLLTLKWEGTDGLNPMDIASMKDWSDPIATETRASAGIEFGRTGEAYEFELAWIPQQTRSTFPGVKSAWLPRQFTLPVRNDGIELRLPTETEYRYLPRREVDDALKNAVASRLQLHGGVGDLAIGFYQGASAMPSIAPEVDVTPTSIGGKDVYQLGSPVELRAIDYPVRTISGMSTIAAGEYIFRLASRYDQPLGSSRSLPTWSQSTVGGVEHTFQFGENALTAILQGSVVRKPEGGGLLSVSDIFDKAVLYGFRFPLGENWLFFVSGFNSTKDRSFFTKHEIGYRFNDHWRTDLGMEILDGPSTSLLGVFGKNDRGILTVTGVY
jgi:hypothetical protein